MFDVFTLLRSGVRELPLYGQTVLYFIALLQYTILYFGNLSLQRVPSLIHLYGYYCNDHLLIYLYGVRGQLREHHTPFNFLVYKKSISSDYQYGIGVMKLIFVYRRITRTSFYRSTSFWKVHFTFINTKEESSLSETINLTWIGFFLYYIIFEKDR